MSAVLVHRCRFVDYTPTPITAIAFPPVIFQKKDDSFTLNSQFETNFMALGRANGNIEIHNWSLSDQKHIWSLHMTLSGLIASKVDTLVFSLKTGDPKGTGLQSYRLFSSGGGSEVIEWNLSTGTILHSMSSQGGSIWSMAMNTASTRLALGCEDGSIRILSLDNNELVHWRRLDRVKTKLLSVAWGPPIIRRPDQVSKNGRVSESSEDEDDSVTWQDSFILAGCSDSCIRKFDVQSGRSLERMTVEKLRGEKTLVWALSVLADGTFVSGDSLGNVKFWDSLTGTQLHSFTAHGADVLCLGIGQDGNTIYSSGVDQKICQFSKVRVENSRTKTSIHKWVSTGARRVHAHDVRALGAWPPYVPVSSSLLHTSSDAFLASGGLDMSLVICPLTNLNAKSSDSFTFENSTYERLPYKTSFSRPVQLARDAKLILCRRSKSLTLWKIRKNPKQENAPTDSLDSEDGWEEVVEMELQLKNSLLASAISNDGSWVAASSPTELKLFRVINQKGDLKPKSVPLHGDSELANIGATSLCFSNDNSKLIIGGSWSSSKLYVLDLDPENGTPRLLRCFEHHIQDMAIREGSSKQNNIDSSLIRSLSTDIRPKCVAISSLATSMDGQWLASGDSLHRIHIFNLDSLQHHCALPSFPHPIVDIAFDPLNSSLLGIALANNTFQVFDVEARQFPLWSRNMEGHPTLETLKDPLSGMTFDYRPDVDSGKESRHVVLWGHGWICRVNIGSSIKYTTSKKRRRMSRRSSMANEFNVSPESHDENLRVIRRYRPLLLVDFIGSGELAIVERPLVDLLSSLPPAYYKPKYGT